MNARIQLFGVAALLITIAASVGAETGSPDKPPINAACGNLAADGAKTCEGVQNVISTVQDAKNSGDSKKMKLALDQAEQQLSGVKKRTDRNTKIAERLRDRMDQIEAQRAKVKEEQSKLDALFYPTDSFVIGD